eukprot:6848936-Prymnesium_polylepis.1
MVRGAGGGVAGQQRARPTRDARAPLPSKAGPRRQRRGWEGQRRGEDDGWMCVWLFEKLHTYLAELDPL